MAEHKRYDGIKGIQWIQRELPAVAVLILARRWTRGIFLSVLSGPQDSKPYNGQRETVNQNWILSDRHVCD